MLLEKEKNFIYRCFDLARLGTGKVSPNPLVGAVLVYENRIIGEGWFREYGGSHAEVNAVASVAPKDRHLIQLSTLYVSLEPCCVYGKTPPCSSLIIENKIPRVVISTFDLTPGVDGESIKILRNAGVEVITDVLKDEGHQLSLPRNTFVKLKRPYIYLKYAESVDGFLGQANKQVWISNALSQRLTHKWRSETSAILIGTNTALTDNPKLNTRYYFGPSPLRIVLDRCLKIPQNSHLLNGEFPTWVIHNEKNPPENSINLSYYYLEFDDEMLNKLMDMLYEEKKSTLMVEGGAQVLNSFIEKELWDEAHVFVGPKTLVTGIPSPKIPVAYSNKYSLGDNKLLVYFHPRANVESAN